MIKNNSPAPVDAMPEPKLPSFTSVVPKQSPLPKAQPFSADNIATIPKHLKLLSNCLLGIADSSSLNSSPPNSNPVTPKLLSSLSPDEVVRLVHCPGSSPTPVAIGLTVPTPRLTGLWRSFIALLAAPVSLIRSTSFRPALTANGLMGGSSLYRWVPIQLSQRLLMAAPSTANNLSSWILSMLTQPLKTASRWAAFDIP